MAGAAPTAPINAKRNDLAGINRRWRWTQSCKPSLRTSSRLLNTLDRKLDDMADQLAIEIIDNTRSTRRIT